MALQHQKCLASAYGLCLAWQRTLQAVLYSKEVANGWKVLQQSYSEGYNVRFDESNIVACSTDTVGDLTFHP